MGEHQRRQRLGHSRREREVEQIRAEALRTDTLPVVVEPDGDGAAERHVDVTGGRAKAGNLSHQVAEQDEHEHAAAERNVLAALAFADRVFELRDDERSVMSSSTIWSRPGLSTLNFGADR